MGRFMQAIFYMLGYAKESLVEDGTQKFQWKTAKELIDEKFLTKMRDYQIMGQKKEEYKAYQTINYVEKLLEEITQEQVTEFDFTAGRLFYWLTIALDSRKQDIIRRKAIIQKDRDERDAKLAAKEKRQSDRDA